MIDLIIFFSTLIPINGKLEKNEHLIYVYVVVIIIIMVLLIIVYHITNFIMNKHIFYLIM